MTIIKRKIGNSLINYYPLEKDVPIYVNDIGNEQTEPNHSFGPAIRPYYLIHFIVKGCGSIERNGTITKLKEGQCFIIKPGEVTTYTADKLDPWEYSWISFSGSFADELMKDYLDNLTPNCKKSGYLSLKNALSMENADNISVLTTLFNALNSIEKSEAEYNTDFIDLALNYIENNYFKDFNATDLADTFGLSRSHFTTVFTKKVGDSPYNYLLKTRLSKAKDLLKNSTLSVTEIAYSVGFSSLERFSDMFKRETSLSPLQFRHL